MRIAISNIAWDVSEDPEIAKLLCSLRVDAIDIAPGKYFPDPCKATERDVEAVKRWWLEQGIDITGMQALLFGTTGLNMFGETQIQDAMLEHLDAVCRIGAGLGATRLVFGSPKNRDRAGLCDSRVLDHSVRFFRRLGKLAKENGVVICLEPNPTQYGANFMTSSAETAKVVSEVDHDAIRMQLDTGALVLNGELPEVVLEQSAHLIGHIHASEPELAPLGDRGTDHAIIHAQLLKHLPGHVVSIEMLATTGEPHLSSIKRALLHGIACYRPEHGANL